MSRASAVMSKTFHSIGRTGQKLFFFFKLIVRKFKGLRKWKICQNVGKKLKFMRRTLTEVKELNRLNKMKLKRKIVQILLP